METDRFASFPAIISTGANQDGSPRTLTDEQRRESHIIVRGQNMKRSAIFSFAIVVLLLGMVMAVGVRAARAGGPVNGSCCDLVTQALKDYSSIKVGSKRSDLERYFRESGGLSFGSQEVYVYR
ncbi:MAG: hypothetical protein WBF42_06820, partial [Terracidiphilus sp.]